MGTVGVRVRDGKKLGRKGIKIEFVGNIELFYDRGHHHEHMSVSLGWRKISTFMSRMSRSNLSAVRGSISS